MGNFIQGTQLRTLNLGTQVTATDYTLVTETHSLFTISGGKVLITSLVGVVTTVITVANTVKLQANPTVGATGDLCAATDIGTTDTPAGNLLGIPAAAASNLISGVGNVRTLGEPIVLSAGAIEQVTTGTSPDGAITWILTYIPYDDGASVAAA